MKTSKPHPLKSCSFTDSLTGGSEGSWQLTMKTGGTAVPGGSAAGEAGRDSRTVAVIVGCVVGERGEKAVAGCHRGFWVCYGLGWVCGGQRGRGWEGTPGRWLSSSGVGCGVRGGKKTVAGMHTCMLLRGGGGVFCVFYCVRNTTKNTDRCW